MKTSLFNLIITSFAAFLLPFSAFADPVVTDVVAKQRYPWNGLVDISFTLSESGYIAVTATNAATGAEVPVRSLRDKAGNAVGEDTEFAPGEVSLVWDAGTDVPETLIEALALSVVGAPPHGKVQQLWAGGPYWARKNIGAENPEDYGLYFWWGDTVGYRREGNAWVASDGSSSNFSFGSGIATYGKDNSTLQSEGWITSAGVLAPEHDAAHVHWGGNWRMPTKDELSALTSNCDWTWTTRNGVNGYVVRGRGAYSSASIFLPAAGIGFGTSLSDAGSIGDYWSSVPDGGNSGLAWLLCFYSGYHSGYHGTGSYDRYVGYAVRPVQGFAQ